jgi:CRP-like cAMP-binding protein
VLVDLGDSSCRYAVRYWLTDEIATDATDSVVRTRIFFALSRARIGLSLPATTVFLKTEDKESIEEKREMDFARRVDALSKIDLFRDLSDEEQVALAQDLHRAPFARGETLTKQGSIAHYLYTIVSGEVSIRIREGKIEREVNKLGAGQFFGEMALLTGERRRATVVALTDVECYRLDASAFKRLLERHADLAGHVAKVLAERETGLTADKNRLDEAARASMLAKNESAFLGRIRSFFGFSEDDSSIG